MVGGYFLVEVQYVVRGGVKIRLSTPFLSLHPPPTIVYLNRKLDISRKNTTFSYFPLRNFFSNCFPFVSWKKKKCNGHFFQPCNELCLTLATHPLCNALCGYMRFMQHYLCHINGADQHYCIVSVWRVLFRDSLAMFITIFTLKSMEYTAVLGFTRFFGGINVSFLIFWRPSLLNREGKSPSY